MNIAILSGKGGTGKTFVSCNLAKTINKCNYLDCDIEEPNAHLFFKDAKVIYTEDVNIKIPKVNKDICISCRNCANFCKFNAIAMIKDKPMFFDKVCHSCGGCKIVCPVDAIYEEPKKIGEIIYRKHNDIDLYSGLLNEGEVSGIPVIENLLEKIDDNKINIIDCPPGSACSVRESISKADFCILVCELTSFGKTNLDMVIELVKLLNKPYAIVINKYEEISKELLDKMGLEKHGVLSKIPFKKEIANKVSLGNFAVDFDEDINNIFKEMLDKIITSVKGGKN